ncbi:immunoglobulin kappa light chain-like [Engraulis encrasicolus]|uniref:immunoglobulin kappa light chain-like n=1 Tax=Engraulis encrasicolus TaxID=184585 RepID=UPI002FD70331
MTFTKSLKKRFSAISGEDSSPSVNACPWLLHLSFLYAFVNRLNHLNSSYLIFYTASTFNSCLLQPPFHQWSFKREEVFVQPLNELVSLWWTFGSGTRLDVGTTRQPSVTVLPPSREELSSGGSATLLCLADKGFPSDWSLSWKVDGSSRSGVASAGLMKDGVYSWSSSLTLTDAEWRGATSVVCEASQGSQRAVSKALSRADCSQ